MLFLMGVGTMCALIALAVWMSLTIDEIASDAARTLIETRIEGEQERLDVMTEDFADWDQAYQWITQRDAVAVYDNIGSTTTEAGFFDISYIYDGEGGLLYAFGFGGVWSDLTLERPAFAAPFVDAVRANRSNDYIGVSGFASFDGTLAIVSAGPVLPHPEQRDAANNRPILINVLLLTDDVLAELGEDLMVNGLRGLPPLPEVQTTSQEAASQLALYDTTGSRVTTLIWDRPSIGREMLWRSGWIIGALALILALGHTTVARASMRQLHLYLQERSEARRDTLTGILNRTAFDEYLKSPDCQDAIANQTFAMLYVDLDNFKDINDTYGHAAGDMALRYTARRLLDATRDTDVVARLGGDEFAVLLHAQNPSAAAARVAQRIVAAANAPIEVQDNVWIEVHASIGSVSAKTDSNWRKLMLQADAAMYEAKRAKTGRAKTRAVAFDQVAGLASNLELAS